MNAQLSPMAQQPERVAATPYKELDYYEQEDVDRFAGRERDISQVTARACTQRSLVVYGRSGLGKTSLLLAGVMPQLIHRGFLPIYVRTLEEPLQDLTNAVRARCGPLAPADASLRRLLEIAGEEKPVIIVLDQFEEFFIRFRARAAERSTFVSELSALINNPSLDLRVVFSLREEYLAALDDFQATLPELFTHAYRLGPLSAFGCREAIVRPLIAAGYSYDEQLVTRLVDELARFDFDSARLQVTCAELFEAAVEAHENDRKLTNADLTHLTDQLKEPGVTVSVSEGSAALLPDLAGASSGTAALEGIFRRYLTRRIAPVAGKWPLVARLILRVMITRESTKYAITLDELRGCRFCPDEDLDQVLAELVERKIVRHGVRGERPWYELRHECLVPEILQWLDEDEDFKDFVLVEQLVQTGAEFFSKGSLTLLDGKTLARVREQRTRLRFTHAQLSFLLRSAVDRGELEDVKVWAEAVGWDEARDFVSSLLRPGKASTGAARAAAIFTSEVIPNPGDLVEMCHELATHRNVDDAVRTAAAASYVVLASDEALRQLMRSVSVWDVPENLRDLVAAVHDSGRAAKLWGWLWRRRARKLSEGRKVRAYVKTVDDPSQSAMFGVFAGLAWSLTGAALLALYLRPFVPSDEQSTILVILAVATIVAVVTGPFLGWRICASAAAVAAVHGEGHWFQTVRRSVTLFVVLWAALTIMWRIAFEDVLPSAQWASYVITAGCAFLPAGLLQLALAGTAQFTIPRVWPGGSWSGVLLWSALSASVLWVLAPAVVLLPLLSWAEGNWLETNRALGVLLAVLSSVAIMSLLTLVLTAVLARRPHLEVVGTPRPSRTARTIVLGAVASTAIVFLSIYLAPRTIDVELQGNAASALTPKFRRWPERVQVDVKAAQAPTLMLVDESRGLFSDLSVKQLSSSTDEIQVGNYSYLFALNGTAVLAFSNLTGTDGAHELRYSLAEASYSGCHVERLVEGHALQLCPLKQTPDGWTATLSGRIRQVRTYDAQSWEQRRYQLLFASRYTLNLEPRAKVAVTGLAQGERTLSANATGNGLFVFSSGTYYRRYVTGEEEKGWTLQTKQDGDHVTWNAEVKILDAPAAGAGKETSASPANRYIVVAVEELQDPAWSATRETPIPEQR